MQPSHFVDPIHPASLQIFKARDPARRPRDLDLIGMVGLSEAERERKLNRRQVALGREKLATADHFARLELDLRPQCVAVAGFAASRELESQPVVLVASVVAEKAGWTVIDGQNDVEITVTVNIGIGRPTADDWLEEVRTCVLCGDELEKVFPSLDRNSRKAAPIGRRFRWPAPWRCRARDGRWP